MFAVIATGGKQYRVAPGDKIRVEKLDAEEGATVTLSDVLMVGEGEDVQIGAPLVDGSQVTAKVVAHGRHDKVFTVKMKRRKHYRRQASHRQHFTELEITEVGGKGAKPAAKDTAKAEKKASSKKATAKKAASKKATSKKAPAKKASAKKAASKKASSKKAASKKATAKKADSEG